MVVVSVLGAVDTMGTRPALGEGHWIMGSRQVNSEVQPGVRHATVEARPMGELAWQFSLKHRVIIANGCKAEAQLYPILGGLDMSAHKNVFFCLFVFSTLESLTYQYAGFAVSGI